MKSRAVIASTLVACLALFGAPAAAQSQRMPALENFMSDLRSTFGAPQQPHPAVVRVASPERDGISYGSGTLVDVNPTHGLVVTNWHVVADSAGAITVTFPDGFTSLAQVLKMDQDWDLAALAIRRPNVAPVRLARQAPRPGDILTIAGYGSGSYRAATGRCTQYVAPGTNLPYEMVELSAAARQGDSGGPIFNEQGELAGVLFGEGGGRTSGSYHGRVHAFLTSMSADLARAGAIAPAMPTPPVPVPPQFAGTPAQPLVPARQPTEPQPTMTSAPLDPFPAELGPMPNAVAAPSSVVQDEPWTMASRSTMLPEAAKGLHVDALGESIDTQHSPAAAEEPFGWRWFTGHTPIEQAKAALAVVGALALLIHGSRWFRTA